jgi:hypothetical protein
MTAGHGSNPASPSAGNECRLDSRPTAHPHGRRARRPPQSASIKEPSAPENSNAAPPRQPRVLGAGGTLSEMPTAAVTSDPEGSPGERHPPDSRRHDYHCRREPAGRDDPGLLVHIRRAMRESNALLTAAGRAPALPRGGRRASRSHSSALPVSRARIARRASRAWSGSAPLQPRRTRVQRLSSMPPSPTQCRHPPSKAGDVRGANS